MMEKVLDYELHPLSMENIEDALRITDKYLGQGMYSIPELKRISNLSGHFFDLVYDDNKAIACFYCHIATPKEVANNYPYIDISNYKDSETIGIFRSIAVNEKYRAKGLAEALINFFADKLNKQNAIDIYALAWMKNDYIPAANCLNNCGYTLEKRVETPWYNVENLKCDICKTEKCTCNGALYKKCYREI